MQIRNIFTHNEETFPKGKADLLLASCVIKNDAINETTHEDTFLAPTLDGEFITNEKLFSSDTFAKDSSKAPSLALITRAVHNLNPFSSIELLDLGLEVQAQNTTLHHFAIKPSQNKNNGINIDAKETFLKGMEFGNSLFLEA